MDGSQPMPRKVVGKRASNKRSPSRRQPPKQLSFALPEGPGREEAIAAIRAARASGGEAQQRLVWRGMPACPPGTLIDAVVNAFRRETNIPLEIPWAFVMTMLSWRLVRNRSQLVLTGQRHEVDTWLTVLAPSGAGKTLTQKMLSRALDTRANFGEPVSAAAWLDNLADLDGVALWVRDEWGQMISQITDRRSPLAGVRDLLLRTYDHDAIERRKKDEITRVEHTVMTVLGLSVSDTWHHCVTLEMMADGLGQRFGYLLALPDPDRHYRDFPVFRIDRIEKEIRPHAAKVRELALRREYTISAAAQGVYERYYRSHADDSMAESYYRRVMWRAFQLSTIFHVLLLKPGPEIDTDDMRYACRATDMLLADALEVMKMVDSSDFFRTLEKAEKWIRRRRERGLSITVRDLMQGVRGIKCVRDARDILDCAKF